MSQNAKRLAAAAGAGREPCRRWRCAWLLACPLPCVWVLALALVGTIAAPSKRAHAQFPDFLQLDAQYNAPAAVDGPAGETVQINAYDVALYVPIPLNDHRFLVPGVSHHTDVLSFRDGAAGFDRLPRVYHGTDLSLFWIEKWPEDLVLSVRVSGGFSGPYSPLEGRSFRGSLFALLTKEPSERLLIGGGALLTYSARRWLPLPVFYVDWHPTELVQLEGFIPAYMQFKVRPGSRFEIGARFEFQGNSYVLGDDIAASAPQCESGTAPECVDQLEMASGRGGLVAGVRLASTLWFTAFGAYTVFRQFELQNRRSDRIDGSPTAIDNSWSFTSRLTWRIPQGD